MSKSFLEEAQQNVVNLAKAYSDMLEVVDAFQSFGTRACHEHIARSQFMEGLQMMRAAIYSEQSEALRKCFYLVGVGGEEATEYSRRMFSKIFCEKKYIVMDFLDKWGHLPISFKAEDEKAFLAECKEAMKHE